VFMLLQAIYQAFDQLAKKHKVFKVETIGDSYVAVTGLPEPQEKHAVIIARFAWDCLNKFGELVKELEVTLGPDTAELGIRFGLHSGSVTAGVLRGERSRFQLFGDTVNTAARMESTGFRNKIQVSHATANQLIATGKDHWLTKRNDGVLAKGKGVLETHWLVPKPYKGTHSANQSNETHGDVEMEKALEESAVDINKHNRLVDWMTELLLERIKKIVVRHNATGAKREYPSTVVFVPKEGKTSLDEVAEVIKLPKFSVKAAAREQDYHKVEIDPLVVEQLRELVAIIAASYRDNPFHNFEQ
jgi:hypothetical protein